MHVFMRATLLALAFCCIAISQAIAQESIPPELRNWQGWVLKGEEFRRCPFLASSLANRSGEQPLDASAYRCVWPERLTLNVDARGGTFTQRWQVYANSWLTLPGNLEFWPQDVRVDGAPGAVVARGGIPTLLLAAGNYTISGRFAWSSRPESLPVPVQTALIDLSVDGQRIAQPERPDGAVSLGKRRSAEQPAAMEVAVYRLLNDDIPAFLTTRLRLNVAGDAREVVLARVLPDGFTPVSLTGAVPARIERDGRLRVQVRAGSHEIVLVARANTVASTLSRPDPAGGTWPREEIWSFASNDTLRVAAAEGAEGIDPVQANVPADWQRFPAFRMAADSKLTVVERGRGLSTADENRLQLERNLWLDFDHGGFTAVDNIRGTMRRNWRLDMSAPFMLASARERDQPLLVTLGEKGNTGIEVRNQLLDLTTVARTGAQRGMAATGWNQRFDAVSGTLHLPPGHRLLAVTGADDAPGSWLEGWGLWSVFGVALVVVFVYWAAGPIPAGVAALALALTYQELPPLVWLWGLLLAALAIARAAPEGRFRRVAQGLRTASFLILALTLLPFMVTQIRYALYPQLTSDYGWTLPMPGTTRNLVMVAPEAAVDYADAAAAPAADAAAPAEELNAPAPPPARPRMESPDSSSVTVENPYGLEAKWGLNSANVVQRYATGTRLQAGPGIPAWQYNSYRYSWSGPVEAADSVRFIYIGPVAMFLWRLLGVIALAVLFVWLARLSYGGTWKLPGLRGDGLPADAAPPVATTAAVGLPALLALGLLALGASTPSSAQSIPGTELLGELKQQLIQAPKCAPNCADIAGARVAVDGDRLEIVMQVSALASLAVAMPHASDRWQLDEVSVDARSTLAMAREGDSSLWVPLTPGAHTVRLAGRLAPAESIQVAFPQAPRTIEVRASGWTVSGVNEGRLVSGSLDLARERGAQRAGTAAALEAGAEFPVFVRVTRRLNLDLDWTMDTLVTRVAPRRAAIAVEIPLVKGESVLTAGVEARDGRALVGLASGENYTRWSSGLERADTFEIALPEGAPRAEIWEFAVSPQWHVDFEGFPPVASDAPGAAWVFRFIPRPGEKLVAHVSRPKGVEGTTLAIDSVSHTMEAGKRSSNHTLGFEYRSTQGGRHILKLPPDARVTAVTFDDQPVQLRPEKGELPLALSPGSHRVRIEWEESRDIGFRTRPSPVELGTVASNLTTSIHLPGSRWPLFASGPGVGPAILYWGELVVFIGIAWLLGRWKHSPLRFHQWLLLGLGLSTQSWWVFALTAAWLFAMRWREGWQPGGDVPRWRFNAAQVLLAGLTFVALMTLLFSGIRNGLLSAPDMGVVGPSSYHGVFTWFQDQTAGALEAPTVYSVPMWIYRALFFVWAGWMAFALVGWLRWAFNAWKTNGLWRTE